jgi:hypothetical protein
MAKKKKKKKKKKTRQSFMAPAIHGYEWHIYPSRGNIF